MRPEIFHVTVLNRPLLCYFPGELLQGVLHIVVGTTQQCKCKGITVSIKGKGKVEWREDGGGTEVKYTGASTYFDRKINVLGEGSIEASLPPGNYTYPFQFVLPAGLPSSFVGCHGRISYQIKAEILNGTDNKKNEKAKLPFTVNSILDLNTKEMGLVSKQIESTKYKNRCCFFCRSDQVGFILKLPRTGYVSGEFIKFTAELNNRSDLLVKSVTANVVQDVIYRSNAKPKTVSSTVCSVSGPMVEAGANEIWTGDVQIPPLPPSMLNAPGCIIEVQYFLKTEMFLSESTILFHKIPITIGSIPLRKTFEDIAKLQLNADLSTAGTPAYVRAVIPLNSTQVPYLQGENYPDLPLPSYAEAILSPESCFIQSNVAANGGKLKLNPIFEDDGLCKSNPCKGNSMPMMHLGKPINAFLPHYITYAWIAQINMDEADSTFL